MRDVDEGEVLTRRCRDLLRGLAKEVRQTVHLGALRQGMVTYLAKEMRGHGAAFTQEAKQLEAYCSGLGKTLLAHLPAEALDGCLAEGPFVALTAKTITAPSVLRAHLASVRDQGWAMDDEEVFEGLRCLAAPIRRRDGSVLAAISISAPLEAYEGDYQARALAALARTVDSIEARIRA